MSHHKTELKDLWFSYPEGVEVLKGISIHIGHSESVAIAGANGAGKSTLLMLLLGLLQPVKGEIRIGDVNLTKKTLPSIRQRMGMVFQNSDDQLFMTTVYDDIAFGPRNLELDEAEVEKRVMEALEKTGIVHLKDRAPFRLSGGEKKSASIATVLSMCPDILVLDEPTSGLDPRSRRRLINLLKSFEHTRIIASHDLDMILEVCERTIILKDGRVEADGPTHEILTNEALLDQCGLELPPALKNCPVCRQQVKNDFLQQQVIK